jgi:hypothetical protein
MARTSAIPNGLRQPGWGRPGARAVPREAANQRRTPSRLGGAGEIAAGALLLVAWTLLWTFFLTAVVGPAARMELSARGRRDASVLVPDVRPEGGPRAVDTAGAAP